MVKKFANSLILISALTVTVFSAKSAASPLNPVESYLNTVQVKGIVLGTSISGPISYQKNEDEEFVPASITKLVTSAQALELLGPKFRFQTHLFWREPVSGPTDEVFDLKVVGFGDPTLGMPGFDDGPTTRIIQWIDKLKSRGVKTIKGQIDFVGSNPMRDRPVVHAQGVPQSFARFCFAALSQSFNYKGNCGYLVIRGPGSVRWKDPNLKFPIKTNISVGDVSNLGISPRFDPDGQIKYFLVHGTWKPDSDPLQVEVPVPDATSWVRNVFISELKRAGIKWLPKAATPEHAITEHAIFYSAPLSEILIPLNKNSDNFLADSLYKACAEFWPDKSIATNEAARLMLKQTLERWADETEFPEITNDLIFFDGAGLSRDNSATARSYLVLLNHFSKKSYFSYLWNSLPIAGTDGTLETRMRDSEAQGSVRAKTGTLNGFYQLAGYIPKLDISGRISSYFPFVILTKASVSKQSRVREFQDNLANELYLLINGN